MCREEVYSPLFCSPSLTPITCPRAGLGAWGPAPFPGPWSRHLVLEEVFSCGCSELLLVPDDGTGTACTSRHCCWPAGKLPLCCIFLGCSLHAALALTFQDDDTSGHLLQSSHLCLSFAAVKHLAREADLE